MHPFVRRLVSLRWAAAAALALLLPASAPAVAQYGRTLHSMVKLTDTDLAIVRKIVREDLTDKPNGTTIPWKNPESQNSGTVTLLDRFPSQGRDCRRVKYLVKPGPTQPADVIPADYVSTTCHLADGSWKLDNSARRDAAR
jgi:17 kDa outer membrane surface antigen